VPSEQVVNSLPTPKILPPTQIPIENPAREHLFAALSIFSRVHDVLSEKKAGGHLS